MNQIESDIVATAKGRTMRGWKVLGLFCPPCLSFLHGKISTQREILGKQSREKLERTESDPLLFMQTLEAIESAEGMNIRMCYVRGSAGKIFYKRNCLEKHLNLEF